MENPIEIPQCYQWPYTDGEHFAITALGDADELRTIHKRGMHVRYGGRSYRLVSTARYVISDNDQSKPMEIGLVIFCEALEPDRLKSMDRFIADYQQLLRRFLRCPPMRGKDIDDDDGI